jgi:trans-2,3-dihydro-3-hydroxyanthranilate isomerase
MQTHTFYIVDVFAERKYEGNQLAVFRKTKDLSDADMQTFAREMHFSETTFIMSDEKRDGGYDVRIFTPEHEIPFAGHPTLGTAFIIQREIIGQSVEKVVLNLRVGQIPVDFKYKGKDVENLWMKQINPTFGTTFDRQTLSQVLNIDPADIDDRYPIQEVSTGTPFFMVPLKTLSAVKRANINRDRFFSLIENTQAKAILIFCPETIRDDNDLTVRVFADYYGVPEDPATGSANGCLAGYLVKHRYFGKDRIDIKVEQGHQISRPSLLFLKAEKKAEEISVLVGGRVQMVARGEFV